MNNSKDKPKTRSIPESQYWVCNEAWG